MKKKESKINYYSDPINEDFATNGTESKKLKSNYNYCKHTIFFYIGAFLFRYLIAIPLLWIIDRIVLGVKIKNRKIVKQLRKHGYFVYSNHVLNYDPIVPPVLSDPGKFMFITSSTNAFNISKFVTLLVQQLGGIPVPSTPEMFKNYLNFIKEQISKGRRVLIYPEKHIRPYYTGIRDFDPSVCRIQVMCDAPAIVLTTTFKKSKWRKKPVPCIYVDGVIYPDKTIVNSKERALDLRNRIVALMRTHAKDNEVEYIKYVYKNESKK